MLAPIFVTLALNASLQGVTDERYVSANLDWHLDSEEPPGWVNASVLVIPLDNPALLQLTAALAPAVLRIGGSEGDLATYQVLGTECDASNRTAFCLSMARWQAINNFAAATNTSIAFGLNCMAGRADGSSPQDLTNLANFLNYTATSVAAPNLYALEYGNEKEHAVRISSTYPYTLLYTQMHSTIFLLTLFLALPPID